MVLMRFVWSLVIGHGAMTQPRPRNVVGFDELPWAKGPCADPRVKPGPNYGGLCPALLPRYNSTYYDTWPGEAGSTGPAVFEPWCPVVGANGTVTGELGQACFWFSNGCAPGCAQCDGSTRGPILHFDQNLTILPPCKKGEKWSDGKCWMDPGGDPQKPGSYPRANPICGSHAKTPTNCDARTLNTAPECGSPTDFYYRTPWRAPGSSPVIDACGVAGGRRPGQGLGGFGASYVNTTMSAVGMLGSKLPKLKDSPPPVWRAGSTVELSFALQANHGGGYSYRLCPESQPTTEACFQAHHLPFANKLSAFRWGGINTEEPLEYFNATELSGNVTTPAGSTWRMDPIPSAVNGAQFRFGHGFEPRCKADRENPDCNLAGRPLCKCSGAMISSPVEIVDQLQLPAGLAPGPYLLGWRWDCEVTSPPPTHPPLSISPLWHGICVCRCVCQSCGTRSDRRLRSCTPVLIKQLAAVRGARSVQGGPDAILLTC